MGVLESYIGAVKAKRRPRYSLFAGYYYNKTGGAADFIGAFDALDAISQFVTLEHSFKEGEHDWWNVLDTSTGKVVLQMEWDNRHGWVTDQEQAKLIASHSNPKHVARTTQMNDQQYEDALEDELAQADAERR